MGEEYHLTPIRAYPYLSVLIRGKVLLYPLSSALIRGNNFAQPSSASSVPPRFKGFALCFSPCLRVSVVGFLLLIFGDFGNSPSQSALIRANPR